jgi:hypothetical protein
LLSATPPLAAPAEVNLEAEAEAEVEPVAEGCLGFPELVIDLGSTMLSPSDIFYLNGSTKI